MSSDLTNPWSAKTKQNKTKTVWGIKTEGTFAHIL